MSIGSALFIKASRILTGPNHEKSWGLISRNVIFCCARHVGSGFVDYRLERHQQALASLTLPNGELIAVHPCAPPMAEGWYQMNR